MRQLCERRLRQPSPSFQSNTTGNVVWYWDSGTASLGPIFSCGGGSPSVAATAQPSSRSRCAACSGGMSLMNTPIADSDPARYFSFSAARRMLNTCRCR